MAPPLARARVLAAAQQGTGFFGTIFLADPGDSLFSTASIAMDAA